MHLLKHNLLSLNVVEIVFVLTSVGANICIAQASRVIVNGNISFSFLRAPQIMTAKLFLTFPNGATAQ